MTQKNILKFKSVIFLLILSISWEHCNAQVNREEASKPPAGPEGEGNAFFALRSCHQLLRSDSGEFFSPDYMCSNPPLWCNWTIQVDSGKRIHLHLEDLTPDDTCDLKQDQIHVDEPVGHLPGHKVLQKCWQEVKYISSSNILYVVLLIGGRPNWPYRGFHGRYQAFGPPVIYNPQEGLTESEASPGPMDLSEFGQVTKNEEVVYDYYDQPSAMPTELPWEPEETTDTKVVTNQHPSSGNYTKVYQLKAVPTEPEPTQKTFRSGRGVARTHSSQPDLDQQQQGESQHNELETSTRTVTAERTNKEEGAAAGDEGRTLSRTVKENIREVGQASDQLPTPEVPELKYPEQTLPHSNMVEPLSDHRSYDHLFEVAVEINFSQKLEESWDNLATSLLLSVKSLISKQLEALHAQMLVSSKRIKRLHAGVLYILWLQIGQGPGGLHVHGTIHSALHGLIASSINLRGNLRKAVIMSVSTADVNECGTQLVLCDINADCVNQFGSYSCQCRPGFQDESHLGSGGTICVDMKAAGCTSGLSTETKGVYVLFFLLSSLILVLLAVAGMLYRRHHQGTFMVHCHSSSLSTSDPNNDDQHPEDNYADPPPPPLPSRGPRECWGHVKEQHQAVDLRLLRFNLLHPPDTYLDPREGVNSQ